MNEWKYLPGTKTGRLDLGDDCFMTLAKADEGDGWDTALDCTSGSAHVRVANTIMPGPGAEAMDPDELEAAMRDRALELWTGYLADLKTMSADVLSAIQPKGADHTKPTAHFYPSYLGVPANVPGFYGHRETDTALRNMVQDVHTTQMALLDVAEIAVAAGKANIVIHDGDRDTVIPAGAKRSPCSLYREWLAGTLGK